MNEMNSDIEQRTEQFHAKKDELRKRLLEALESPAMSLLLELTDTLEKWLSRYDEFNNMNTGVDNQ